MADVLFLLLIVAFFALMVAFVRLCERVVGTEDVVADHPGASGNATSTPEEAVA